MKHSPACRGLRRFPVAERLHGFTLLELLIVLVIAGVLAGVVTPLLQRLLPGAELQSQARLLQAELRQARSQAILLQQPVRVSLAEAEHGLRLSSETRIHRLPASLQLTVERGKRGDPREAEEVEVEGSISFYPQGYSSGGLLSLSGADGRQFTLEVDWLTGRVRRNE